MMPPIPIVPLPAPAPPSALVIGVLPSAVEAVLNELVCDDQLSVARGGTTTDRVALRTLPPSLLIIGTTERPHEMYDLVRQLKTDGRTQIVPVVVCTCEADVAAWFEAGADEVLDVRHQSASEITARLRSAERRARRDVQVNPSTRLAGADAISEAISARLATGALFAAGYADLDHFKEFNDRYGFSAGDAVIRTVADLISDVVELATDGRGFVGHIGGDDFLFLVPFECHADTCDRLIAQADGILRDRYSPHDRQAGYFFGKDRRGRLDRVPLMTLSIGVVSNEKRRFHSPAQVSELATEMKSYAKTLPGSVWAIDRRSDSDSESAKPPEEKLQ